MAEPWYRWPKGFRQTILQRDNHHCQIRLPVCKHTEDCYRCATVLDHIIPVLQGGPWFEPSNVRAACWPCNQHRRNHPGPLPANPTPARHHPEHW